MADAAPTTKRSSLHARLIAKAQEDPAFKQRLMDDPRAAIQEEFGIGVPADVEIEVLEEQPTKLYLVLPAKVDDVELSDEMLEKVAGGSCGWDCTDCGSGC